jgi:hypothetical protein
VMSKVGVMSEYWITEDLKGSSRDLNWDTITEFAWWDWGKPRKIWDGLILRQRFEPVTSQMQLRSVIPSHKLLSLMLICTALSLRQYMWALSGALKNATSLFGLLFMLDKTSKYHQYYANKRLLNKAYYLIRT